MKYSENVWADKILIEVLAKNGVVVMPTDTIYGIVGRAEDKEVVEKIYKMRGRSPLKPCIVLIGDVSELKKFNITLTDEQKKIIESYGEPTSFILDCPDERFSYLHRGTKTLAFRIPKENDLKNLLLQTGPLVAPSANREGEDPAQNIEEAKKYFGDLVDLYVNGGEIKRHPSKVIRLYKDGSVGIIRE